MPLSSIVMDLCCEWLRPLDCINLNGTGKHTARSLSSRCSAFGEDWQRTLASLQPLLDHGMRCPRLDGIRQVLLYPNPTDISADKWLQDRWNVCTAVPAGLRTTARHAGVDQVGLLRMLNRARTFLLHRCFDFIAANDPIMHLYVDAVPHRNENFNFIMPGRYGGSWVSVYVVHMQVGSLKIFMLCYELDAAWVPTTPDSDAQSVPTDNEVLSSAESSVWVITDSNASSEEEETSCQGEA